MSSTIVSIMTVADLHRSSTLLDKLRKAVLQHRPDVLALVGDFLHAFDDNSQRETNEACAKLLAKLRCPEVVFIRGNHEDNSWYEFAEAWKRSGRVLHALHGEAFVRGPLTLLGFPCSMGDETAFIGSREPLPVCSEEWLPAVMHKAGRAGRTLWLTHEPPVGTPLSQANSAVEGNPDWNFAIERFAPQLIISGHDHLTPIRSNCWHCRIGPTTCVNVGQTSRGPLHYCLVEAEFADKVPDLPAKITVTAYPWNETVALPWRRFDER